MLPLCASLAASQSCLFSRCAAARLFPHVLCYAETECTPAGASRGGPGDAAVEKRMTQHDSEVLGPANTTQAASPAAAAGSAAVMPPDKTGEAFGAREATETITAKKVEQ